MYDNLDNDDTDLVNFSGVAFLSFKTIEDYESYYKLFPKNILHKLLNYIKNIFGCCSEKCKYKKNSKTIDFLHKVLVERSPEPFDIIWENLGLPTLLRKKRKFITYILSILLTLINFSIILSLDKLQVYFFILFLD